MKTKIISFVCIVVFVCIIGISAAAITNNQPENNLDSVYSMEINNGENKPEDIISEKKYAAIKSDLQEEITQQILYDRMLNAVDYFECVSIKYKTKLNENDIEHIESIDSDIPKNISYTTFYDDINQMESYCDGKDINVYYLHNQQKDYFGGANVRTECEMKILETTPRHSINENDGYDEWLYRSDLTNSIRSDDTIFPQGPAFLFLSDFEKWKIIGETDYIGRRCIELQGNLSEYAEEKFNSNSFYMCIDKLTGILLKLECYNKNGEIERYTTVSEINIDQPEITDSKIEAGINKCNAYLF